MLAVDLPGNYESLGSGDGEKRVVVLGPAIPAAWKGGRVRGLRLRGGGSVDFSWDDKGVVDTVSNTGRAQNVRLVNVKGESLH
jgi:alpha-L-fucosidase 2